MTKQIEAGRHEIDMTRGPLLGKILKFSLPVVMTNVLQLLFNAADTIIVGRFDGSLALAAVGATSAVIFLITNLFMGLSLGTGVAVAQHKGAGEEKAVSETFPILFPSLRQGLLFHLRAVLLPPHNNCVLRAFLLRVLFRRRHSSCNPTMWLHAPPARGQIQAT